jgi:ABC-2 type transport system permease protein
MNAALFARAIHSNVVQLAAIAAGLVVMGTIMPVMYAAFGQEMGEFVQSVPFLAQFANFGGGNLFSLEGTLALGFGHPITLLLFGIVSIQFPALAIAGERDKGTLEVTLSRPISRRVLYVTLFVAGAGFIALLVAILVSVMGVGSVLVGLGDELDVGHLAQLWLAGTLLFGAFMSLAFAASVESDRAGPAIGIPAAFMVINYLAFAIGSIWPEMQWLQEYSFFNLLKAQDILLDGVAMSDVLILLGFSIVLVAVAMYRFPRRDLPAPS